MSKIVLHIAEAPGGVERYLITLLTKMQNHSDYEHILVCSSAFDIKKFKSLVSNIVVIESMQNAISIKSDCKAICAVRKAINKYKPNIVYCHSSKAGAIGRIANIGIKNLVVYNAHGWAFNINGLSENKKRFYKTVERILAKLSDKIVCISEFEKKSALREKICESDKLVVINNGINFDEYKEFQQNNRSELGIPEDMFVVGAVGRLTKQKAPETFVKMAKYIKNVIPNAFFVMVGDDIGDGLYRKKTELMIEEANLTNSVLITGWVDVPLKYIACFDVATLLSRWEGFGLVLPEYMLMGKPIVATKADAIPYVVGNAGILVDIDDYNQAAEAVVSIYRDSKMRLKLIENGKERVKRYDAQRMAYEHVTLFHTL